MGKKEAILISAVLTVTFLLSVRQYQLTDCITTPVNPPICGDDGKLIVGVYGLVALVCIIITMGVLIKKKHQKNELDSRRKDNE